MNSNPSSESERLEELRAELASVELSQTPLLSIAIWGWQGDGKTTSLLTATHFAEPLVDLLGFALVREHDEISEIAQRDEYREIPLLYLAKSSTAKIDELQARFIDGREWPDGTDTGSAYLVRVEDAATTRAFAVITDLPGGSYSENDVVAEKVITNAHAIMVMVAPERWMGQNLRGRAYRNMVTYRIRRCTQQAVPVSVLVAQSDRDRGAAKEVVEDLRHIIEGFQTSSACRIFAVSVIQDDPFEQPTFEGSVEPELPPAAGRNPRLLVTAWVWTLVKALVCEMGSSRPRVPVIELEQTARGTDSQPASLIELRGVGDFSGLPGTMLCPIEGTGSECSFLVVRDDGTLVEVALSSDGGVPRLSNLGRLEAAGDLVHRGAIESPEAGEGEAGEGEAGEGEAGEDSSIVAGLHGAVFNGELIVGPRTSPDKIWSGLLHDLVRPLPLPSPVVAWDALSADLVCGLGSDGRLHRFQREGDQWRHPEFISEFLPEPQEGTFCVYIPGSRVLIVGDGSTTKAVRIEGGKFGERVNPPLQPSYFVPVLDVLSSSAGSVADLDAECELQVTTVESNSHHGRVHPEAAAYAALGTAMAGLVAWVGPDLRLRVAIATSDDDRASEDSLSPILPRLPIAFQWATGDKLLAVDLGDETWQLYRLHGL